jgi:hypothetical protein
MRPNIQERYERNCKRNKKCKPEPRIKRFPSGVVHYVSQCSSCGFSYGQPFSKKILTPEDIVEPFDEDLHNKFYEENYKAIAEEMEKYDKLNKMKEKLKLNYFKDVLKLPIEDFETTYNAYINSSWWKMRREYILKRDKCICQYCLSAKATEVHHFSYHNLGNESPFELVSVCKECHRIIHSLFVVIPKFLKDK